MSESIEQQKTAGATVYLIEELGDARMRCDQLLRYIEKAVSLVEKSSHKDHFFEVAGDVIRGIPETAFKLHKALEAVALAANRIDYEEIKQDLRPEKVEELERVLKDVRVRQVQRRSLPMLNPGNVVEQLKGLAKKAKEEGQLDTVALGSLIASLEVGALKVASGSGVAAQLEAMSHALENPPKGELPSRQRLAQVLRRVYADHVDVTAERVYNDDPTFEIGMAAAAMRQLVRGPRSPQQARALLQSMLRNLGDWAANMGQPDNIFKALQRAADVVQHNWSGHAVPLQPLPPNPLFPAEPESRNAAEGEKLSTKTGADDGVDSELRKLNAVALEVARDLDRVVKNAEILEKGMRGLPDFVAIGVKDVSNAISQLKRIRSASFGWGGASFVIKTAEDEEKRSRFEEGKPADPTENMSEEDAKEWKENVDEHGDKFKKDAASRAPDVIFKRMKDAVESMLEARVKVRQVHEDLSGINSDATGTVFTNNYRNSEIEKVAKSLYDLDGSIGDAWRGVERLEKTMRATMLLKSAASVGAEGDDAKFEKHAAKMTEEALLELNTAIFGLKQISRGSGNVKRMFSSVVMSLSKLAAHLGQSDRVSAALDHAVQIIVSSFSVQDMLEYEKGTVTAADEEKRSRYEQGKPADPTENMSEEDAKAWKENTDEHGDKFKTANKNIPPAPGNVIDEIMSWHGGQGSNLYSVGSMWNSGKSVDADSAEEAYDELERHHADREVLSDFKDHLREHGVRVASLEAAVNDDASWKVA